MMKPKSEIDPVLSDIRQQINDAFGENALQIILFGSWSRGDEEIDSDYDILLLVRKRTEELEDQVDNIAYQMLDRYGVMVSIFVVEIGLFERDKYEPLFCNVRREGVVC